MNSVIMCEGKTDAILLSYFLNKVSGWTFVKKPPKNISINVDNPNYDINWYKKSEDYLLIFSVGGKDNFTIAYKKYIKKIISNYEPNIGFNNIAIIKDKDKNSIEDIVSENNRIMGFESQNQKWTLCEYEDQFMKTQEINVLSIVIPEEGQGALENVLLASISEDEYDKNIVEKSVLFIDDFGDSADRYIKSNRLKTKAKLSAALSVLSPELVFSEIDERVKLVEWEKYSTINSNFSILKSL